MAFLCAFLRCSASKRRYTLHGLYNISGTALKSTAAGTIVQSNSTQSTAATSPKDPLDLSFEDARAAFKSKTTWELFRAYLVYEICSINYIVEHNMKVGERVGGSCDAISAEEVQFYWARGCVTLNGACFRAAGAFRATDKLF